MTSPFPPEVRELLVERARDALMHMIDATENWHPGHVGRDKAVAVLAELDTVLAAQHTAADEVPSKSRMARVAALSRSDCWCAVSRAHTHAEDGSVVFAQSEAQPLVGPIERDESYDRMYIPLPGGWEIQTKGKGSSFRLCNTKTGDRLNMGVGGGSFEHDMLEQMAREIHAACTQVNETPASLTSGRSKERVTVTDEMVATALAAPYCSITVAQTLPGGLRGEIIRAALEAVVYQLGGGGK